MLAGFPCSGILLVLGGSMQAVCFFLALLQPVLSLCALEQKWRVFEWPASCRCVFAGRAAGQQQRTAWLAMGGRVAGVASSLPAGVLHCCMFANMLHVCVSM